VVVLEKEVEEVEKEKVVLREIDSRFLSHKEIYDLLLDGMGNCRVSRIANYFCIVPNDMAFPKYVTVVDRNENGYWEIVAGHKRCLPYAEKIKEVFEEGFLFGRIDVPIRDLS